MKKLLMGRLAWVVVMALRFLAGGVGAADAAGGKTIAVGVNSENPPWVFSKDGKMTGFEVDLLGEFAKRADYKIEYKSAPFATVLTGVQSGQWYIAMSSIWIQKERMEVMDFADPYYDAQIGLMVKKEGGITKFDQMKGKTFGFEKPFEISDIRKIIIDLIGKKKGFRGKVFGLQLTDIIQMNCLGRLTTALIITRDGEKGVIYLNEGEIIHAECGEQKGTDAFYKILSWQQGEFVSNIGVMSPVQTIYQNWEHLLVEAMRRTADKS